MSAPLLMAARPAQRLLLQGVMASTYSLVRGLRDGQPPAAMRSLMGERRRMLTELARDIDAVAGAGSLAALTAAMAESDRTLEALLG